MKRLFLGFLISFFCGDAMFEVSGTPKDLSFLFRYLVRRVSSLCVSISTLDSKCWTVSVAVSCPSSSLILLMEQVSCSSRYWYRASSKVIMTSDTFCIIPFAHFKKRIEGNPGALMVALSLHFSLQTSTNPGCPLPAF